MKILSIQLEYRLVTAMLVWHCLMLWAVVYCVVQGRESIAAKLTANLITEAGADRVLAMDLHSGQCVGYFDIPVDHVYGETVILDYLASKRIPTGDLVVVSPDVGGVARARAFAKKLNDAPLAIIDKRRSAHNVSEVMHLIGDVKGKVAVLVDDMIDTAGTITNAGKALLQEGAREVRSTDMATASISSTTGCQTPSRVASQAAHLLPPICSLGGYCCYILHQHRARISLAATANCGHGQSGLSLLSPGICLHQPCCVQPSCH